MTLVLKAKHWQIFLILIGLMLLDFIAFPLGELGADLSYLIFISVQIGWILILGSAPNNRCKHKRTFWPIMGIGLIVILYSWFFRLCMDMAQTATFIEKLASYEWLALAVFSFASMIVISAFPAKALKLIEMNEDVDINDCFTDFLSILFWPIGIWFIQPRINKLVEGDGQPPT